MPRRICVTVMYIYIYIYTWTPTEQFLEAKISGSAALIWYGMLLPNDDFDGFNQQKWGMMIYQQQWLSQDQRGLSPTKSMDRIGYFSLVNMGWCSQTVCFFILNWDDDPLDSSFPRFFPYYGGSHSPHSEVDHGAFFGQVTRSYLERSGIARMSLETWVAQVRHGVGTGWGRMGGWGRGGAT